MRRFISFWWQCACKAFWGNTAFANDWQWVFGVPFISGLSIWAVAKFGAAAASTGSPIADGLLGAFGAFVVTWTTAFFARLFNAPVQLDRQKTERLDELEKVDRQDLQHMLGGRYFGNTFMYDAEITLCKKYDGKLDLEHLKGGFDMISVRAPKKAMANITFHFLNMRQEQQCRFYCRTGNGEEIAIDNIYECKSILLDDESRFGLKMICDERYLIDDNASLTVGIKSWAK
jgi:hypothetical protein